MPTTEPTAPGRQPDADDYRAKTGTELRDIFLAHDVEGQVRMAGYFLTALDDRERGQNCDFNDHAGRLAQFVEQHEKAREAIRELRATATEMSEPARPGVLAACNRLAGVLGLGRFS